MRKFGLRLISIVLFSGSLVAAEGDNAVKEDLNKEDLKKPVVIEDLAYGHILFEYYRGNTIEALNAILVAQKRNQLANHKQSAKLLSGVIYLDLGMLDHAQSIFNELLSEEELKSTLLAKIEFYLAKVHYRQADYAQAEFRLLRVMPSLKRSLKDEALIMLANIAVYKNEKSKAEEFLSQVEADSELLAYSRYNLGILFLRETNLEKALPFLERVNLEFTDDRVVNSLQDKAFTALGFFMLSSKEYDKARSYLQRVRLSSPSANKALLAMGWSYLESHSPKRALSHWLALRERDIRDLAVQEALVAIPYAYQKLDSMQEALDGYIHASNVFQQQIEMIDELKRKIREDNLIESFLDKLILAQTNEIDDDGVQDSNLFGDEFDYYLFELVSQHQFNESYRNYQKLGKLAQILKHWEGQLPIFDEILNANQTRFNEKLPLVEKYLAQGAFEQYENELEVIRTDIAALKTNKKLHLLANEEQLDLYARIERVIEKISRLPEGMISEEQKQKARRAQGVLQWQLETNKVEKIWQLEKLAKTIGETIDQIRQRKSKLAYSRDIAEIRFAGFESKVEDGKAGLYGLRDKIHQQIAREAFDLKEQIISVLDQRRATLDHYLLQSDLSVARLHDQAVEIPEAE
ncbi:lipopolysaccharide assembly protein LapB [Aliikangiella sp. G2MR2-5]|uniref:tetratricopeptide repeat protein n=1 Tax=Aliikangiella sp. G2MR2-5 TaxID=2788943 RepID=UPI0018AC0FE4|nr:hypothetical protein [Aliikangiella sp. G2MR2-5]